MWDILLTVTCLFGMLLQPDQALVDIPLQKVLLLTLDLGT